MSEHSVIFMTAPDAACADRIAGALVEIVAVPLTGGSRPYLSWVDAPVLHA